MKPETEPSYLLDIARRMIRDPSIFKIDGMDREEVAAKLFLASTPKPESAEDGAKAERAALLNALKPFAELSNRLDRNYAEYPDYVTVFGNDGVGITHGDFRKASRLLAASHLKGGKPTP